MYTQIREAYKSLTSEQKAEVLAWASEKYNLSPTSVKNNWMYLGSVPKQYVKEVIAKLTSF